MNPSLGRLLLRLNASYIGIAGAAGLVFDICGVLTGLGPQGQVLAAAPHAAIGFVEAHGLAVILAVLLWRGAAVRASHVAAFAMEVLLGTSNLAFWQLFVDTDALALGYITTGLHWLFAAAQFAAAIAAKNASSPAAAQGFAAAPHGSR